MNGHPENRLLPLLGVLLLALATACAAPTDPNQNDDAEGQPSEPEGSALLTPAVEPPLAPVDLELRGYGSTLA